MRNAFHPSILPAAVDIVAMTQFMLTHHRRLRHFALH
jgi:hypothetical protein